MLAKYRAAPSAEDIEENSDLHAALDDPDHVFTEAALTADIVEEMRQVPRSQIPDMPDRIIAATGIYLSAPVISSDRHIRASSVQTIW